MSKNITFIHLWNNYTGSTNVLRTIVDGLYKKDNEISIISSFNNKGFLSDSKGIHKNVNYHFRKNKIFRLLEFVIFQAKVTFKIFGTPKDEIIFINTIQPFLPAIIAHILKRKVVYYIHESKQNIYQKFLYLFVDKNSDRIICVSRYVMNLLNENSRKKASVIYNSLSENFTSKIINRDSLHKRTTILMVSSAKIYKGIADFCLLAGELPQYKFVLVCSNTEEEIDKLLSNYKNLSNLQMLSAQKNMNLFYENSDLILNLSHPYEVIETFGMTILEGMAYGLPAIVPPVGGISELVEDGFNGFKVDVRDKAKLIERIQEIMDDKNLYNFMSKNAKQKSLNYSVNHQIDSINEILKTL